MTHPASCWWLISHPVQPKHISIPCCLSILSLQTCSVYLTPARLADGTYYSHGQYPSSDVHFPANAVCPKLFYLPAPYRLSNPPTCSPCSTAVHPADGTTNADTTPLA